MSAVPDSSSFSRRGSSAALRVAPLVLLAFLALIAGVVLAVHLPDGYRFPASLAGLAAYIAFFRRAMLSTSVDWDVWRDPNPYGLARTEKRASGLPPPVGESDSSSASNE